MRMCKVFSFLNIIILNSKYTRTLNRVSKTTKFYNHCNLLFGNRTVCWLSVANVGFAMSDKAALDGSKSLLRDSHVLVNEFTDVSSVEDSAKRKCEHEQRGPKKKKVKLKKSERPGYGEDRFDETEYYFENGLRKVRPYYFTFSTYCKGRWINKKLIDVYSNEFRAQPKEEFERCIRDGQITVNGKKVPIDYVLLNGDYIANTTHRHELPVVDHPIKIIHESEDLIVVDKPPSIPVHPCGRYRHNTVIFILGKDHGFRDIRNIHRIDRLTSGLLIFARNLTKDRELKGQICSRLVKKEYLCRVEGKFPSEPIVCSQPIAVISYKIGVCRVTPDSKECTTEFRFVSYNGKSSVVLCKPVTGRMHQIRVHLQYLGYPIVNDPLYNHVVFGPNKGKNGDIGKSDAQLIEDLIKVHTVEAWLTDSEYSAESDMMKNMCNLVASTDTSATVKETVEPEDVECKTETCQSKDSVSLDLKSPTYDPHCPECVGRSMFRDPRPEDLIMYLHAWKYQGPGWEFETDVPEWAKEDWIKD